MEKTWEVGRVSEGQCHRSQERQDRSIQDPGALSGMVAVSQRRLLSTCNVASAPEEIRFLIILKFKQPHEARGLDSVVTEEEISLGRSLGLSFLISV